MNSILIKSTCILIYMTMFYAPLATAQTVDDSFTITTNVSDTDIDAPTVPANVVATPVATTQIDVSWNASNDNVGVAGYQLFRDGVQIATTTLTSYSDIGLLEGVTYSYALTAFDDADNFSAQSAPVSTTTLITPPPPSPEEAGGSVGGGYPEAGTLASLEVIPATHSAVILWRTYLSTRSVIRWGTSASYELGVLAEHAYSRDHGTRLTDLLPDTHYEFEIVATDAYGRESVIARESFRTYALPDTEPPSNPSGFTAVPDGAEDARLRWRNPPESDFAYVRVVRNHLFYPDDPYDGALVYEGSGTGVLDAGALGEYDRAYYAIFAIDARGNISSGALAAIAPVGIPETTDPNDVISLSLADIEFIQNGKPISFIANDRGGEVPIDHTLPLTIRIAYDRLPEELKTILVTLTHPNDPSQTFSFLLRVNADKTAYVAQIAPLPESGRYPIHVTVVNHERASVGTARGELLAAGGMFTESDSSESDHVRAFVAQYIPYLLLLILLLLIYVLYRSVRRVHP